MTTEDFSSELSYRPRSRGEVEPRAFCSEGDHRYAMSFYWAMMLSNGGSAKSGHIRFVHSCGKLGLFLGGYAFNSR